MNILYIATNKNEDEIYGKNDDSMITGKKDARSNNTKWQQVI